ncbi:hypothetical protein [Paraburkholderia youngii]|uniref:hypothetical protein n=1 Tax=Paraburkholderia youngii TaxID=2782701 RepID=UPI003D1F35E3
MKIQRCFKTFRAATRDVTNELERIARPVAHETQKLAQEVACAIWYWRMFLIHVMLQPLPVQLGLFSVVLGVANAVAAQV